MSTDSKTEKSPLDVIKWLLAIAFLGAAVAGNSIYADMPLLYRVLGVVVTMLVGAGIALTSTQGKAFLKLLREANIERRKVVWPTRQETGQTTLIVVAVVIFMAIVLWGVDSLLSWSISLLLG